MDRIRLLALDRGGEGFEQVGTPNGQIGKTVALDRLRPEVEELPRLAGLPMADFLAFGRAGQSLERLENPKGLQRAGSVRAQLHPGADFREPRRLLVDIDLETPLQQGECRRQPADPGAGDQHMRPPIAHGPPHPRMRTSQLATLSIAQCRMSPGLTWLTPEQVPLMMMSPGHKV